MSTGIKNICHNFHNSSLSLICTKIVYIQVTFLFSKKKKNLVVVIIIILFFLKKKICYLFFFPLIVFFSSFEKKKLQKEIWRAPIIA